MRKNPSLISTLVVFFSIFCAVSCVTQRRCYNKFPPQDTVISFVDTVYIFTLETDTIYKTAHITDTVYAATGTAGGSAWVINDTIYLNVWQKDTIFEFRDSIKTITLTKVVELPCRKTPVLTKLIILMGIILTGIIVLKLVR